MTSENEEIREGDCILHLVGGVKTSDNGSYVVNFPGSPFALFDSRDRSLLGGRNFFKILVIESEEKNDLSLVPGTVVGVLVVVIVVVILIGLAIQSRLYKTRWSPQALEAGEHTDPKVGARYYCPVEMLDCVDLYLMSQLKCLGLRFHLFTTSTPWSLKK